MTFQENTTTTIQPAAIDILCGRGKAYANHPGNVRFTQIIQSNLEQYESASKRIDRSIVLASLVDQFFDAGCRFLKQNKATKKWMELETDQCHEKVGHAIRDLIRKNKRKNDVQSQSSAVIATSKKQQMRDYTNETMRNSLNFACDAMRSENVGDLTLEFTDLLRCALAEEEEGENGNDGRIIPTEPIVTDNDDSDYFSVPESPKDNNSSFTLPLSARYHFVRDSFRNSGEFDILENRHDLTLEEDFSDFRF